MVWKINIDKRVLKDMQKLGKKPCAEIIAFLDELVQQENPRSRGKSLRHELKGLWRYRVGKYRIICEIQDKRLVVLAIAIGHRREVYK